MHFIFVSYFFCSPTQKLNLKLYCHPIANNFLLLNFSFQTQSSKIVSALFTQFIIIIVSKSFTLGEAIKAHIVK